jgi:ATP-dependent DNA helicase RecG
MPPHRVAHDLTQRQREILQILSDGKRHRFNDVYARLNSPVSDRWVREDMSLLRKLRLIDCAGRGPHARWWLVFPPEETAPDSALEARKQK